MLSVASQRNVPPYCAVTAGPNSHSPAPTADPATTTPGPISSAAWRQPNVGGGISSPVSQGVIRPSRAATASAAAVVVGMVVSNWVGGRVTEPYSGVTNAG